MLMLNYLLILITLAYAIFSPGMNFLEPILLAPFLFYFIYLASKQRESFKQIEDIKINLAKLIEENQALKKQLSNKDESEN